LLYSGKTIKGSKLLRVCFQASYPQISYNGQEESQKLSVMAAGNEFIETNSYEIKSVAQMLH
jgi:hypothetical protein